MITITNRFILTLNFDISIMNRKDLISQFKILGRWYTETSVRDLKTFITDCRKLLTSESQFFWVAVQPNSMADIQNASNNYTDAIHKMKNELTEEGWIFPTLKTNMRNQVNIAKITAEFEDYMQSSIEKLKPASTLVGDVPLLFKLKKDQWGSKKDKVLKHCIELMAEKSGKNIVVLFDDVTGIFRDVADVIKRVVKDKQVVPYPSYKSKKEDIENVKIFVEKTDHILATKHDYFDGCEAPNIIYLSYIFGIGIRNYLLRGVENLICVQLDDNFELKGIKEDRRFYDDAPN